MTDDTHWLQEEIGLWESEGIVSAAQAERIRVRVAERLATDRSAKATKATKATDVTQAVTPAGRIHWGPLLVNAIGVIVIGLGIILFFAYNWASMPKWSKLALVFGGVAGSHALGLLLDRRSIPQRHALAAESFHLLGTMLFGAGIFLVSQIYHVSSHFPNAFVVWGLGAAAMAWAMPSVIQGVLAAALLATWGSAEQIGFDDYQWQGPLVVGVLLLPLAWRLRSPALLSAGLLAFLWLAIMAITDQRHNLLVPVLLLLGVVMTLGGSRLDDTAWQFARKPVHRIGLLAYGVTLGFLAFNPRYGYLRLPADTSPLLAMDHLLQWTLALALAVTALGCIAWWWLARHHDDSSAAAAYTPVHNLRWHALTMAGIVTLVLVREFGWLRGVGSFDVVSSLLIGLHGLLLILRGTDTTDWKRTTLGCLLIAVALGGRFFALFDSLLLRSLAFMLIGIGLVTVGVVFQRKRRQRTEGDSDSNDDTGAGPTPLDPATDDPLAEADHA